MSLVVKQFIEKGLLHNSQELFQLAMKHIYGDGVPEDNELAVKLLTQAYEMGHVEATYNLGICYHYGHGTTVDLAKAYELYLESANAGYGKGMELVGRFYNRGIYVEQDRKHAEYWLQKAVESFDPDAVAEARKELAKMDNVFIRKAIPGDEQVLAYIQTESWKAAFAGISSTCGITSISARNPNSWV